MITVEKGDVYIVKHRLLVDDIEAPVKSLYFVDRIRNEELGDAMVITFWRCSLPTLYYTTLYYTAGPLSEILRPPAMGTIVQGETSDWFEALDSLYNKVGSYSKRIIEEAKE